MEEFGESSGWALGPCDRKVRVNKRGQKENHRNTTLCGSLFKELTTRVPRKISVLQKPTSLNLASFIIKSKQYVFFI